jgi:DNA-directed RNA polymerase subunit RPC12/RpoP
MDRDPQTQAVKMRPVFKTGPTAAAGSSKGAAAPPPAPVSGAPAWNCPCGRAIEAHVAMSKSDASCPGCGRKIRLEKWRHPHSSMTMIRPVFGDPEPPPGRPAPAAPAPAKAAEELVSFEELEPMEMAHEAAVFEVAAGSDGGDAPPTVDGDAQIAPCECGAEILLSQTDVGPTIQCPACADTIVVEQDGKKIMLRVVAALDDPDWKLDEFQ